MTVPNWLTPVERMAELHAEGIQKYSEPGVVAAGFHTNRDCLEGVHGNALSAALYSSDSSDPDPLQCAIYMFAALNKAHCFTDGNKRVAWMVLIDALLVHGLAIAATQPEAIEFCESHANGEGLQIVRVTEWVSARLVQA